MAEDLEVGVLLKPKNNLEDEVDDVNVGADVDGGGRRGRGGVGTGRLTAAAGIVRGAGPAIIAGLLAAILSQLRSIQEFTGGLLRTINRLIAPLIAGLVDFLRPVFDFFADALANFDIRNALNSALSNFAANLRGVAELIATGFREAVSQIPGVDITQDNRTQQEQGAGRIGGQTATQGAATAAAPGNPVAQGLITTAIEQVQTQSSDREDEEKKNIWANAIEELEEEIGV